MTELICLRSLWATLTAAASTCALFAASNWGTAGLIANESNFYSQILEHIVFTLAMPMFSFLLSMWNALEVLRVKRCLAAEENNPHYGNGSISIIALCPIYIKIPAALASEDQLGPHLARVCRSVTDSQELTDVCPLELQPRQAATRGMTNTDGAGRVVIDHVEDSTPWMCFQLPDTSLLFGQDNAIAERLVLLSSILVPTYKELSFLRSRNMFQSVVTALQAGGYMLSVLQRVVQHRGISPIEAIVTFLCIIVALQLLIELYACGNYQRPLLLRLDARQFERFRDVPRKDFQAQKPLRNLVVALILMMWLLISIPAIYYFSHYVHMYLICALSALLFFLSQTLLVILVILAIFYCIIDNVTIFLTISSMFMFPCSIIVAMVSTIVDWKAFQDPILHNWFAWILPHASS